MASPTIETWVNIEKPCYEGFIEMLAIRCEDAMFRSLSKVMNHQLAKSGKASVTLPWGTYSAKVEEVGEGTNITPTFEPSKAFKKLLNDDDMNRDMRQTEFDPEWEKLFKTYVALGRFEEAEDKNMPAKQKGARMSHEEVDWFINDYLQVLCQIARDKQRTGKTYRLEINEGYPHGSFDFIYNDDGIDVKFTPHKIFKQALKDDEGRTSTAEFSAANWAIFADTNRDADGFHILRRIR